jgi:chemosensory pili system protein ChpA (sensor histidine kinase/response regulator)
MNHHLDQEVVAGFISEAKGYLPEIMLGLESFAADTNELASLREAFRYAHIIKGAASMLGFLQISEVAYQLEVTLEMLCEEHLPLSQELLEDLCQNVGDLAELLDQSLLETPAEDSTTLPNPHELLGSELLTSELSTSELSTDALSIPELPLPDLLETESLSTEPMDWPAMVLPGNEVGLPVLALTPTEYEEKGETILLPSTESDEEILPEARTNWSSFVSPEFETEEPFVSLLDDTSFSVSLPETTETPTIGDLDLNDVAQELKDSYGACSLPQPEFTLPEELMAGLPDLKLELPPEEMIAPEMMLDEMPAEDSLAAIETEGPDSLLDDTSDFAPDNGSDVGPNTQPSMLPDILEDSEPTLIGAVAFDQPEFTEKLLPASDSLSEVTPAEETMLEGASLVSGTVGEMFSPVLPDFAVESLPEAAFDEAPPEPTATTDFKQQPAIEEFDTFTAETNSSLSEEPVPASTVVEKSRSAALSSPAISDEIADELMETFLLEAEEHLQNLHTSLRVLYKNPNQRNLLQEVRRSSHSLKGTAAMVGLDNIMQLAHRMEDLLDLIYDGEMQLTQERTLLLMQATDALEDMSNGQSNAGEVQRLYDEFTRVLTNNAAAPAEPEAAIELDLPIESETPTIIEPVAPPPSFDQATIALESETETSLQNATAAESLLPDWPFEATAPASFVAPETEAMIPEPVFETVAEVAEELPVSTEPVVPMTSAEAIETGTESFVESTVFSAPAMVADTPMVHAVPEPVASVEAVKPVETAQSVMASTMMHDQEVLPSAQGGTMAQTSSQFVRVPIERLDDVVKLISEMIITRTMFEQRLADFGHQVEELQMTGTRLRRASTNLESKYEVSTLGGGRPAFVPNNVPPGLSPSAALAANGLVSSLVTHNTHGFDDLEFDRYTEFHLVSRELVESSTDIQTLGRELNHLNSDFLSYLNRQGRIYSDLQDRLMRLRMVPLSSLAPRLHRTVRTVGVQQHKEVELILEGEATAIDTTALQEMTDPLLHLLRNAVDHGIEAPDVRVAQGKTPNGKIILRAFYEGSQVVIQLRDDGQGLDLNRIRNRALQYALITSAEAETMSPQELWALIFTPGFSTAETVSEISGRGVGMDVVHTTVQKLKGTIVIDSQPQIGTTFTIRLPLTLAVTRSLMVKANGQTFAIPLDVVSQIMRLEMSKVERIGKEPVIRLGGKVYPLLMLSRLLNLRQPSDEVSERPPALLLSVEGKEVVVIVDQLMGGREVVIKTLGNHLRKIHGVMGATLMGDGEVVLILNLAELLRGTVRALPRRALTSTAETPVQASPPPVESLPTQMIESVAAPPIAKTINQTLTIMIVDDSPSVRRVSSNMIKNIGWIPTLAKDGLDALEQLQASETPPDLILLDIEMPRMDGYQFLGAVRSLPAYRTLPVVIVSSRSSEKHRQKAFDLGATEYLVKPYQEDNVITLIRRLVKENHQ